MVLINKGNIARYKKFGKGKRVIPDGAIAQTPFPCGWPTRLPLNGCFPTSLSKRKCECSLWEDDSGRREDSKWVRTSAVAACARLIRATEKIEWSENSVWGGSRVILIDCHVEVQRGSKQVWNEFPRYLEEDWHRNLTTPRPWERL